MTKLNDQNDFCQFLSENYREVLPEFVYKEFRQSAVPDDLTEANVEYIVGDTVREALAGQKIQNLGGHATQYATYPVQQILKNYEFAAAGGWGAWGTTLAGGMGEVVYFKPQHPRPGYSKGFDKPAKLIKYETPAGCPALPLLPYIPKYYLYRICERFGVVPLEDESAWQTIQRGKIPIAIVEGFKKALAVIAQGIPAIAIRGISQWNIKGKDELHPIIADFATPGRKFYVCFDQDEKATTRLNVQTEAKKLGKAIQNTGGKAFICEWDRQLGKGVDDALFNTPEDERSALLEGILDNAKPLNKYKRIIQKERSFQELKNLEQLTYPVERSTTGDYLPELPALQHGAIHILSADMNSGKTTRMGADWVQTWKACGGVVVVLTPLNSLGQQTAKDWDLPHIHDYRKGKDGQEILGYDIDIRGGIVLCPDSLHRLPDWAWQRPILLFLDEANQVIEHLTQGDTLKHRWDEINQLFAKLTQKASAIVASEANLSNRAVKFLQQVSDKTDVRVFTHKKVSTPWDVTVYDGGPQQVSGFWSALITEIALDKKIYFSTTSKITGRVLERVIKETWSELKVVRVDSDTNEGGTFTEFFEEPDQWLESERPDILICSPSVKSGVSIQGNVSITNAYFDSVWGYFPSLTTSTHLQLLGRFRPAVPRHIYSPEFILSSSDEDSKTWFVRRKLEERSQQLAAIFDLAEHLESQKTNVQDALQTYLAESKVVNFHQKQIARDWLIEVLNQAGHQVKIEKLSTDPVAQELFINAKETLWREDAAELAGLEIQPHHDIDWAKGILESGETTRLSRLQAYKVLRRSEFPGITWDNPEDCYQALVKDYGQMMRGVKLECQARNLSAIKEIDRQQAEQILKNTEIKAYHRLPRQAVKAAWIATTGVLELIGQTYDNNSPQAQVVKAQAVKYRNEIWEHLRLNITPNQTPVEIANKLLKKIGLKAKCLSRQGSRNNRTRQYQVEPPSELREQMTMAYSETLKKECPQFLNKGLIINPGHTSRIENLAPNPPPRDKGGGGEKVA